MSERSEETRLTSCDHEIRHVHKMSITRDIIFVSHYVAVAFMLMTGSRQKVRVPS